MIERSAGRRELHWTKSIAVSSKAFLESIQEHLSFHTSRRRKRPLADGMDLREETLPYNALFDREKSDIDGISTWD